MNTEQALEEIFRDDDEVSEEGEEVDEEEDNERERLREFLAKYEGREGFDKEFFIAKSLDAFLPIIKQSISDTRSDGKIYLSYLHF